MPKTSAKQKATIEDSRTSIPDSVIAELLIETRRRCCLCYFLNEDKSQKRVQIAHIDRKRNNAASSNLVPLCLNHHDEYDSSTSQSKGITMEELRRYKNMLIAEVKKERRDDSLEIKVEERQIQKLGGELFYGYGILFAQVSRILFKYDPAGINFENNDDEYDAEAHDIIAYLQENSACLSTFLICQIVFSKWFWPELAKEFNNYEKMAREIDNAWEKFKSRNLVYSAVDIEDH